MIERTTKPSVVVPSLAAIAAEITATSSVSSVRSVAGAAAAAAAFFSGSLLASAFFWLIADKSNKLEAVNDKRDKNKYTEYNTH